MFVFRDPVEVMVSNLKSLSAAPCVRIPRQEKARKAAKLGTGPKGSPRRPNGGGGGRGGGGGGGGGGGPFGQVRKTLDDLHQEQAEKDSLERDGGSGGGRRRLMGGWAAATTTTAQGGGAVYPSPDAGNGAIALWEEDGEEEEAEEGGSDWGSFGSVSCDSYTSGGVLDPFGSPLPASAFPSQSPALDAEVAAQQDRRLLSPSKRSSQLTMDMTMECADWLKVRENGGNRPGRSATGSDGG